jgi:hypothetical protein
MESLKLLEAMLRSTQFRQPGIEERTISDLSVSPSALQYQILNHWSADLRHLLNNVHQLFVGKSQQGLAEQLSQRTRSDRQYEISLFSCKESDNKKKVAGPSSRTLGGRRATRR